MEIHHDLHGDMGLYAFAITNMIKQATFTTVWTHMQLAAEWFTRQMSLFKYRWNMTNQGCHTASGFSPNFQFKGPASVWPLRFPSEDSEYSGNDKRAAESTTFISKRNEK